jgi:hypothetical protein
MAAILAQTGAQEGLAAPTPAKTLSQSSTIDSTYEKTLNGHGSPDAKPSGLPTASTLGKADDDNLAKGEEGFHQSKTAMALSSLPAGRKSILLLCFCLAYVPLSCSTTSICMQLTS